MRLLSRLLMPILLLLFSGTAALAQEAGWRVSEAKGNVIVIDASGERKAATGLAVAPGATVRTAARSTAVLVRGREFVTLRQNAQIRIPQATKERSLMQVIQDYGSALFNIGKQRDPHFGVQTPYLAAVVKGTTFVITVGPDGATLQVTEGAVEVSTMDGGAREMILPGAVAMVAAGDMMRMVVEGDGRKVIDSPARPVSGTAATPAPAAASENAANRVDEAIASSPGDVSRYSGGFASGEVAVIAAVVVSENTNRGGSPAFGSDSGRGNGGVGSGSGSGGSGNGDGGSDNGSAGNDMGDDGDEDDAGDGNEAANGNGGAGDDDLGGDDDGAGDADGDDGDDRDDDDDGADNGSDNGDGGAGNGNGNGNNGNGNGNGGGNGTGDEGSGNDGSGNGNGNGNGDDAAGNDRGPRVRVRLGGIGIDLNPGPRMDDPALAPRDHPGL